MVVAFAIEGDDMVRYEIGMSENNLPHWTSLEALKELIQNNVFARVILGDTTSITHNGKYAVISNSPSGFTRGKLLIGESEQRNKSGSPGDYGEGLKVGMLVALRSNREIYLETNGFTVHPTLEPSSIDPTVNGLTYYIEDTDTHEGTTFYMECSLEELTQATQAFAILNGVGQELLCTDSILPQNPGLIFVNGVSIAKVNSVFGYNFTNSDIKNRDRNMVDLGKAKEAINGLLARTEDVDLARTVIRNIMSCPTSLEAEAGVSSWRCPSVDTWRTAIKLELGDKLSLATGLDTDTKARYYQYKVLVNVPSAWKTLFVTAGVPYTDDLQELAQLPKNMHRKPNSEQATMLGWCKRLCKLYVGDYGTVKVSEHVYNEHGNECNGLYERKTDTVWLKASLLESKEDCWKILVHETLHRITGAEDNTPEFTKAWENATWGILMRGKSE